MKLKYKKIVNWTIICIGFMITSLIFTEVLLSTTGRRNVPCGEDAWRWGLLLLFLGGPVFLCNYFVSIGYFFFYKKNNSKLQKKIPFALILQGLTAFVVYVGLTWPDIIFKLPICE